MEQSAELKELTLRLFNALASGNIATVEHLVSRREGSLAIGTDPKEWWAGYAVFTRAVKAQMDEMGGGIPVMAGEPDAYSEGSVGWFADRPMFKLPDGTEVPFRATGVFHREDGEWKLVQLHASIGVANEEAVGQDLTV